MDRSGRWIVGLIIALAITLLLAFARGEPWRGGPEPASVLGKLDRMFAQFPSEQMVTLAYLVVDPLAGELVVSNAGHPAPVLLRTDGTAHQLPDADGCPLAVLAEDRHESRVPVRAGDIVLLFTDGLIERRGEDFDVGQARVLDLLPTLAGDDLAGRLQSLVVALRDPSRDDDVAAPASMVTDAYPDGWYIRVMFDELLDPDIEELEEIEDPDTGEGTGTYYGTIANTKPVTLECESINGGMVNVEYDGYYSPAGNQITWPLGPSLVIKPNHPELIATNKMCRVTLKENIVDKSGDKVPAVYRESGGGAAIPADVARIHWIHVAVVLLLLADMIGKPWA